MEWCPTDNMVAAYFTKPLCGDKFKHFRQEIMNMKNTKLVTLTPLAKKGKCSDSQENVENNMSQVSKSLAEINIRYVEETMRKKMNSIPLKDRMKKKMYEGMVYSTVTSGIKEWCRIAKDNRQFVSTWSNGSSQKQVISRTTYDMHSGKSIEHMVIDENTNSGVLHKRFPKDISWIKAVLLYRTNWD